MRPIVRPLASPVALFAAAAALALLAPAVLDGGARAAEVERLALEDTWIDGTDSDAVNGSDIALGICPLAEYWIYLKFDLQDLPGELVGGELRIVRSIGENPQEIAAYLISDDGWDEATLSGTNRPLPLFPPPEDALAYGEDLAASNFDRWTSPALDAAIVAEAAGDGTLTLMVREDPAPMFDVRYYRSKEFSPLVAPRVLLLVAPAAVAGLDVARDGGVGSGGDPSLSWPPGPAGTTYDVAGGRLSELHVDGGVAGASCLAQGLALPEWVDPRPDPPAGDGEYYLVRAVDATAAGSWGTTSNGARREPLAACP